MQRGGGWAREGGALLSTNPKESALRKNLLPALWGPVVIKLGVGMHWEGGGRDPDILGAGEGGQVLSAHPRKEKGIIHCRLQFSRG